MGRRPGDEAGRIQVRAAALTPAPRLVGAADDAFGDVRVGDAEHPGVRLDEGHRAVVQLAVRGAPEHRRTWRLFPSLVSAQEGVYLSHHARHDSTFR
jgi:hypothetical protein